MAADHNVFDTQNGDGKLDESEKAEMKKARGERRGKKKEKKDKEAPIK